MNLATVLTANGTIDPEASTTAKAETTAAGPGFVRVAEWDARRMRRTTIYEGPLDAVMIRDLALEKPALGTE
jgi:hypothetical protein